MSGRFLGVHPVVWALIAFAIGAVWVFLWPADKAAGLTGVAYLVLRWGHALVWLLLGLAALAASSPATLRLSQPLALAALGVYAGFVFVFVTAE